MLSPPQLGSLASVIAEPFTSCSRTRAFRCADLKARAVLRREATRSSQNSSALRSLIRSWPLGAQFKSGGLLSALDLAVLKRHGVWLLLPTAHGAHFPLCLRRTHPAPTHHHASRTHAAATYFTFPLHDCFYTSSQRSSASGLVRQANVGALSTTCRPNF